MNYTLQLHGERQVYPIPPGLSELMSDISREVLRQQPALLYQHIADYLDTLVRLREAAKTGEALITDVLGETQERLGLVAALGLTWEEADSAARRIQAGYRGSRLRRKLRDKQRVLRSQSFQEYLRSLSVDWDETSQTSTLVEEAYCKYIQNGLEHDVEDWQSTRTIEGFDPKGRDTLGKKDSKTQVYEQSPRPSMASTWSDMVKGMEKSRTRKSKTHTELVYQQNPAAEIAHPRMVSQVSTSSETLAASGGPSLPSYYDEAQAGVPMVDETGQLSREDVEKDIVTLYSADSLYKTSKKLVSFINLPSQVNPLQPRTDPAREIIDIIERRTSRVSQFIHSLDSLDEGVKRRVEDAVKHDMSQMTVAARSIVPHSATPSKSSLDSKSGRTKSKSSLKGKHSDLRINSKTKSASRAKVEFTGENLQ